MIEDILAVEEEHADDLADLLFAMAPNGEGVQRLYFNDEIPGTSSAGTSVKAAAGQKSV